MFSIALTLIATLCLAFYVFMKTKFRYWKNRNVRCLDGEFPFGNMKNVILGRNNLGVQLKEIYDGHQESDLVGFYMFNRPALLVRDPEIIKLILVKDFDYFADRGIFVDLDLDPLEGHLFGLHGEKWRLMRNKLSPTFTSGKLKTMFGTMLSCGDSLNQFVNKTVVNEVVDVRDLFARYAMNIIATVAFGVEVDSLNNPDNIFRKMGLDILKTTWRRSLVDLLSFMAPEVLKYLKIKSIDRRFEDFFVNVVRETLEHREKNDVIKKDFIQLLLQLRNGGKVGDDGAWKLNVVAENVKQMSLHEITAQALVFFLAGFETSSLVMSFCLYELAKHQDIQRKAQESIDEVYLDDNFSLNYENIGEMKYLECVIDETMRKYPPLPALIRICGKDYKMPESELVIEKGTLMVVSVSGLHFDEQYFDSPEDYNPDRFMDKKQVPYTFMPFGEGPRSCIAMRMGRLQTKIGLAIMLKNFTFELGPTMKNTLDLDPKNILNAPLDGIKLKINRRIK